MQLKVEFLGLARELAQAKESVVHLGGQALLRDLVRELADRYPALVGPVIIPGSYDLCSSYMLNIGGRQMVRDLDTPVQDGQHVLLMFAEAGG